MTTLTEMLDALEAEVAGMTPAPWHGDASQPDDVILWGPGPDEFLGNAGDWGWQVPEREGGSGQQYAVVCDLDAKNARGIARLRNLAPELLACARLIAYTVPIDCEEHGEEHPDRHSHCVKCRALDLVERLCEKLETGGAL